MEATTQGEVSMQHAGHPEVGHEVVEVTVDYLPAPKPFRKAYREQTVIETVRTDAMAFFGVRDSKDRDTHEFFLEFEGRRLTNMLETLQQLLGPHRHEAHFSLVEQVIQGAMPK